MFQSETVNVPVTVMPTASGLDFRVIAHEPPVADEEADPDQPNPVQPVASGISAASALAKVT